eukprot:404627_1
MSFELEHDTNKSPKSQLSANQSNHSFSPIPDLNDDNDDDTIPTTTPYTIASAQIVPVTDRADVNVLHEDDDDDAAEQKKKEEVIDRFSIIVDSRNNLHALKTRSFEPDNEIEDDQLSPRTPNSDVDMDSGDTSRLQTPKDIGTVAQLTNSSSSNKFTLNSISNMAFSISTDKSNMNRNNSPGFTLNSIQENSDMDGNNT